MSSWDSPKESHPNETNGRQLPVPFPSCEVLFVSTELLSAEPLAWSQRLTGDRLLGSGSDWMWKGQPTRRSQL